MRRKKQLNQDSIENSNQILRNDNMAINETKFKEMVYDIKKPNGDVEIHKFPRSEYSFVNGIKDDKDFLIITKKGVLDEMAEAETQDTDSAKRVDSKQSESGYWTDSNGNLRHPGDGLGDDTPLKSGRDEFISNWGKK